MFLRRSPYFLLQGYWPCYDFFEKKRFECIALVSGLHTKWNFSICDLWQGHIKKDKFDVASELWLILRRSLIVNTCRIHLWSQMQFKRCLKCVQYSCPPHQIWKTFTNVLPTRCDSVKIQGHIWISLFQTRPSCFLLQWHWPYHTLFDKNSMEVTSSY